MTKIYAALQAHLAKPREEEGLTTIEWAVIGAGAFGLATLVIAVVTGAVDGALGKIG